jgi:hypothetical protein
VQRKTAADQLIDLDLSIHGLFCAIFCPLPLMLLLVLLVLACGASASASASPAAPSASAAATAPSAWDRPPAGWNAWFAFDKSVTGHGILRNAEALVRTGLREAGYT